MDNKVKRAEQKILLSNFKLNTLLEITTAINNNQSKEVYFSIFEKALVNKLHISKILLYTYHKGWNISFNRGVDISKAKAINVHEHLLNFDEISVINTAKNQIVSEFDVVIPVYHKSRPLAFLLLADFEGEKIEVSPIIKHLKFIQTFANIVIVALENKFLYKEQLRQVEMDKELELARNMQNFLFPKKLPNNNKIAVEAWYLPHSQVGGDYYDVIELSKDETAFCIADVSGKGISAALLMSNFQANLRAILDTTEDLQKVVNLLNKKVIDSANYEKYITLFLGIYNSNTRELSYINAGHQPAIVLNGNDIQILSTGCTVLGMFDEFPKIDFEKLKIHKDSKMICYTDGLSEIENAEGDEFGIEGIKKSILNVKTINTITKLKEEITDFIGDDDFFDDITLLSLQFP